MISGSDTRVHTYGGDRFMDSVRSWLTLKRLKKVLPKGRLNIFEIGCGSGIMLKKLIRLGHFCVGVDPGNDHYINDKFENIDIKRGFYDVVFAVHVIEHLEDIDISFKKCYEMLKDGGLFYMVTPNELSRGLKIFGGSWWFWEDPTHLRFFSPKSLRLSLEKAGFKTIRINMPITDSLAVEAGSLMRKLGVFNKILLMVLIPIFFIVRLIYKPITPSMEAVAIKEAPCL